ncbi:MAG: hypothetical protein ABSG61_09620 [Gemmatimonadales bacterium]|jgi:hypothetical protein
MRALRLAMFSLLVATSLAAQTPAESNTAVAPVAVVAPARTAFLDLAALVGDRQRFGLEPLTLGRWMLGLVVARIDTGGTPQGQSNVPTRPCLVTGCAIYVTPRYLAWSVDLAVRWYPPLRSRHFVPYLGEFVGYNWRTFRNGVNSYRAGWEPGAEIGLRARALGPLFVDVGGWFKLVRLDDPTQNVRPGSIDSRFVAAVGIGW